MKPAIAWVGRALRKLFLDPLRYARGGDYRAEAYWRDRFRRHGDSSRGPGHEGLSAETNDRLYAAARALLERRLDDAGIWSPPPRVLEIGPGTGIWTEMCEARGVRSYTAVDVTSERFMMLQSRFPTFDFVQGDAADQVPQGPFDLVLCLDVIEHVVREDRLTPFLANLQSSLAPGGLLALSYPEWHPGRVNLYYLRFWPAVEVLSRLPLLELIRTEPFRVGGLQLYRRPHD